MLEDVQAGRFTGLYDRRGTPIADGDHVINFNTFDPSEEYAAIKSGKAKVGVPAIVRRFKAGARQAFWVAVEEDGSHTGIECTSALQTWGVEVVR